MPTTWADDPRFAAGSVLAGRYEVVRRFVRSDRELILEARDRTIAGMQVALKILPPRRDSPDTARTALRAEALRSTSLTHGNIARILRLEEVGDLAFLVLEFLLGPNLERATRDKGVLSLSEVLVIARDCCAGLSHAHRYGVVHGNVCPANLIYHEENDDGLVKVAAFRVADESAHPQYAAPELSAGRPATSLSDQYSLAASLFFMLAGQPPPIRALATVPYEVNAVLAKAMAAEPERRFPDVTAFLAALERAVPGSEDRWEDGHAAPLSQGAELPPATTLNERYVVVREVGRGPTTVVYEAEDRQSNGFRVAIAVVPRQLAANKPAKRAIVKRTGLAALVVHPHVAWTAAYREDGPIEYIVRELLSGPSLGKVLHDRGPFDPPSALAVVRRMASAIEATHAVGLVHGDVAPDKLLYTPGPQGRILKLSGLTGLLDTNDPMTRHLRLERIGATPTMAPEVLAGVPFDGRVDQYGLAATLYELLTGAPPFDGPDLTSRVLHEPPPRCPSVPDAVAAALQRALAKSPVDRFPSLQAFVAALH